MVTNFAKAMGYEMPTDEGGGSFSDTSSIASYAKAKRHPPARRAGVIDGYEDGSFRPNASASRAEAAVLYQRFLDNLPGRGLPDPAQAGAGRGGARGGV